MASSSSSRWRYLPFVIGGVSIAIGLALALANRPSEPAEPLAGGAAPVEPPPTASASGSAQPELPAVPYRPDLSGPDLGVRLAPADGAVGLGRLGRSLVWLETDDARLETIALGSSDSGADSGADAAVAAPRVVSSAAAPDAFGGSFAHGDAGVYWVVDHEEGQADPIRYLTAEDFANGDPPRELAASEAPDGLVAVGDELLWIDRGRILRATPGGAPREVVRRDQRIAAMTATAARVFWLELPYESGVRGAHEVMATDLAGAEPKRLTRLATVAERSQMVVVKGELVLAEGRADRWWLLRVPLSGGNARPWVEVGPVTALAGQGDVVYWAEAHERDGATLSVLFRANVGEPPVRLGRARGGVAALLIGDDALYWASTDGIFRQARPAP